MPLPKYRVVTTNRVAAVGSFAWLALGVAFIAGGLVDVVRGGTDAGLTVATIGVVTTFGAGFFGGHFVLVFVNAGVVSLLAPRRFVRSTDVREFDVGGGDVRAVLTNGYPMPIARSTIWGLGDNNIYVDRVLGRMETAAGLWPTTHDDRDL